MPIFAKAADHQGYPNALKLADDACIVQRTMLPDQRECAFDARQVLRRTSPASDPNPVDVAGGRDRQLDSVDEARANLRRLLAFVAHPELGIRCLINRASVR